MNTSTLRLFTPAVVLALAIGTLYILGWANQESFRLQLGLSPSQFPLPFEEILLKGFAYPFQEFFTVVLPLLGLVFILIVIIQYYERHQPIGKSEKKNNLERPFKTKVRPPASNTLIPTLKCTLYILLFIIFIGVIIVFFGGLLGQERAQDFKKNVQNGATTQQEILLRTNDGVKKSWDQ